MLKKLMQHSLPHYNIVQNIEDLQKSFFVRGIVFCEEQKCTYIEEFDEFDYSSIHFLVSIDEEPIATARLRVFKDYVKIERLAVRKEYRGNSIGKNLFIFTLRYIEENKYEKIILHAQSYLLKFYADFGFIKKGNKFIEAGIEHYYMERYQTNKL